MRASISAWLAGVLVTMLLFVVAPAAFNAATPPILGLPPLHFWFLAASFLQPFVMAAVYFADRAWWPQAPER